MIFVYWLLACSVAPHSCGGVCSYGWLPAIVVFPIMYALAHWLQHIIVPHYVFPFSSSIWTQMFTVGSSGKLAHPLHSISLAALQLACLCSGLAQEWARVCGRADRVWIFVSLSKPLSSFSCCVLFTLFSRNHLRGHQSSLLGLGVI